MLITVCRFKWDDLSTLGRIYIDGNDMYSDRLDKSLPSYTLEDTDRSLYSYMSEKEIASVKVYGKTAIPYGKYKLSLTHSEHFKKILPLLSDVKGFQGIRLHNGSYVSDSLGCLLGGYEWHRLINPRDNTKQFWVSRSKEWFADFMLMLEYSIKKEEVFIEIVK